MLGISQNKVLLFPVLVGYVPIPHISLFPFKHCKYALDKNLILPRKGIEHYQVSSTTNEEFFAVNLVESIQNVYSPGNVHYVNLHKNNEIINRQMEQLASEANFKFLKQLWPEQMHW